MVQTNSIEKPKIICIVGPTGVGKSALSILVAKNYNGEIISADSMQIYRDMNIGTAKIEKNEMQGIPHYMLDEINPTEKYSVALFKDSAEKHITDICNRAKIPIIVGGTGLYVSSLLYGYDFGKVTENEELRKELNQYLAENGEEKLWNKLSEIDSNIASNIPMTQTKRVIRAIEKLNSDKMVEEKRTNKYDYYLIGLNIEREQLYDRINKRVDLMIKSGIIEEAKLLLRKYKLTEEQQAYLAIGYKEMFNYIKGNQTLEKAIDTIKQSTRNYAKRQLTWFKKMDGIHWYNPNETEKIMSDIKRFMEEK